MRDNGYPNRTEQRTYDYQHTDEEDANYPSAPVGDIYDDGFPEAVAGHVQAVAVYPDDTTAVNTDRGPDVGFDGSKIAKGRQPHRVEGVGARYVNDKIGDVVRDGDRRNRNRSPVATVAQRARYANYTLPTQAGNTFKIADKSNERSSLNITNQGSVVIYIGKPGLAAVGGQVGNAGALVMPGQSRTLYHTEEVWVSGANGAVFDVIEETYA
jgi:hypothetical protein